MFVTYLTIYEGDKLPPFYIGSTTEARIGAGYRGSVRSKMYREIWESELKLHPELFDTIILSTHDTREQSLLEEERLQKLHKVVSSELFVNMGLAKGGFVNPGFFTPEQRLKMSASAKARGPQSRDSIMKGVTKRIGMKRSEETKKRMSEAQKVAAVKRSNAMSAEQRKSLGNGTRGKPWSQARRAAFLASKEN